MCLSSLHCSPRTSDLDFSAANVCCGRVVLMVSVLICFLWTEVMFSGSPEGSQFYLSPAFPATVRKEPTHGMTKPMPLPIREVAMEGR